MLLGLLEPLPALREKEYHFFPPVAPPLIDSSLLRSHASRYRSYPSLKTALTRLLKINSPLGLLAGGIGARGTPRVARGGGGGERDIGEPGGERFPLLERMELEEWEDEEDVRRERGREGGWSEVEGEVEVGGWEVLVVGEERNILERENLDWVRVLR